MEESDLKPLAERLMLLIREELCEEVGYVLVLAPAEPNAGETIPMFIVSNGNPELLPDFLSEAVVPTMRQRLSEGRVLN